jgi:hypothetical protein
MHTPTLGDLVVGGRFRNLRDRIEAQRRFHSLMTHEISKRYVCGVNVTERHKNGGIHFHLVVVCKENIYGQIDFAACFPPKDCLGKPLYKPVYLTANKAIHREWAYWLRTAKLYGFGRHQLQPGRISAQGLGQPIAGRQGGKVRSLFRPLVKRTKARGGTRKDNAARVPVRLDDGSRSRLAGNWSSKRSRS